MKTDSNTTIQELKDLVSKFTAERHWQKHHTPKNLTMNLIIEAAELMDHYVWELDGKPKKEEVADELADVFFNVLNFADKEQIDLSTAFINKYQKLQKKYPTEKFAHDTINLEEYRRLKKEYRSGGSDK